MIDAKIIQLNNERCSLVVDNEGGAITSFRMHDAAINPLNFSLIHQTAEAAVEFKGHFLCLGRWGDPSAGESEKGSIKHGDFNWLRWHLSAEKNCIRMSAGSAVECLTIEREINLDSTAAVYSVTEKVVNVHTIGRLYNMVQHPTIAAPYLNEQTIVDSNCSRGFDYNSSTYDEEAFGMWPHVPIPGGRLMRLDRVEQSYSSVFSFVVDPADEHGWITAFSPEHGLLIGYCWKRSHYPWLNHWLHFEKGRILYRGLEFGTTGVHKPFREIWHNGLLNLLGERTCSFIDADESHTRSYFSFLHELPRDFKGVQKIHFDSQAISIVEKQTDRVYTISHHLNLTDGFQG